MISVRFPAVPPKWPIKASTAGPAVAREATPSRKPIAAGTWWSACSGLVEVARQRGVAGDFLSVTWPGFAGLLTAVAPGRFAASINQAPMRRRTRVRWLLWLDYALGNAALSWTPARASPSKCAPPQA